MRHFITRVVFLVLFTVAAGAISARAQTKPRAATKPAELPDQVSGVQMLYGTSSKGWKIATKNDAAGSQVKQNGHEEERLRFFANGTFSMTGAGGSATGKYTFDQASKTITMIFDGASASNTFAVENLTDKNFTLKSEDGAALVLQAE